MNEEIKKLLLETDDYYYIFELLFDENNDKKYISKILNNMINESFNDLIDYELFYNDLLMYFEDDIDKYEYVKKYMDSHFKDIINNLNTLNLIHYHTSDSNKKSSIINILNNNTSRSLNEISKNFLLDTLKIKYEENDITFLTYLIQELLTYEQKKVSDIKLHEGSVSRVLEIGDKILKIGRRQTFRLLDDKRYLRPILRREFKMGNEKICIEITERVNNNVTDEDLEVIIEEFKKKGKDWRDQSLDNIGRLIKPNRTYFKYPILSDTGYIKNEESNIILDAGDIVILDNDHTYDKVYTKK